MSEVLTKIIYVTIMGLVISSLLLGLRTSALKQSYDNSAAFNVTDSGGTIHTVAASGISGDVVAMIYALASGLVMLAVVIVDIMLVVKMIKTK